jgi:hypothetical protein
MGNDIINPYPAIILHNLLIYLFCGYLYKRGIPFVYSIVSAFVLGFGATMLWREISYSYRSAWDHLIYIPFIELKILDLPLNYIFVVVTLFIFPFILSSSLLIGSKKGARDSEDQNNTEPGE